MKIGIIKERKKPTDKRVPLSPNQCAQLQKQYPKVTIMIEPSEMRCFEDNEYLQNGIELSTNLGECDILMGVKEVPKRYLLPNKTYLFFSHTIKKQSYNRSLLQHILQNRIELIDYETLKYKESRIVAFGRYAGIVGAYNALLTFGLKQNLYHLKPAHQCSDLEEIKSELKQIPTLNANILVTGAGRVSLGAKEILDLCPFKATSPENYITSSQKNHYTLIDVADYVATDTGKKFSKLDFFKNPLAHKTNFTRFIPNTDILITGAYWDQNAPRLFETIEVSKPEFNIKVIADITCDIKGSVPTTIRPSTINDPIYDIDPNTIEEVPFAPGSKNISVMAVDNLPCELPKDASASFGNQLIKNVFPQLLGKDDGRIKNAAITTKQGTLTANFNYLGDWVNS